MQPQAALHDVSASGGQDRQQPSASAVKTIAHSALEPARGAAPVRGGDLDRLRTAERRPAAASAPLTAAAQLSGRSTPARPSRPHDMIADSSTSTRSVRHRMRDHPSCTRASEHRRRHLAHERSTAKIVRGYATGRPGDLANVRPMRGTATRSADRLVSEAACSGAPVEHATRLRPRQQLGPAGQVGAARVAHSSPPIRAPLAQRHRRAGC